MAQKGPYLQQPYYTICTFTSTEDKYVSWMVKSGQGWEKPISKLLFTMMGYYGKDTVYVDAGTNIGTHALYIAKGNYSVYGVEPQPINLNKVVYYFEEKYCSFK